MMLPISVCVPLRRRDLFEAVGRPSIAWNAPAQVVVIDGPGSAPEKRNRAAAQATQPYLFFCDDDIILMPGALARLYETAVGTDAAIVYGDFLTVHHPTRVKAYVAPGKWDVKRLHEENYISTMSLIRRAAFPGWDETISRFQDYDLWLTIAGRGGFGAYVPELIFVALYMDQGITTGRDGYAEALAIVHQKHGIKS